MKVYFVTYGSGDFLLTARRLAIEAHELGFFEKIFSFTEKDLPISIQSSPLFHSKKGGGYWLWKPFIIQKVLNEIQNNDIVVYSDAGNELFISEKWQQYFDLLKIHSSIFFQYKENFDYGWKKFNASYSNSAQIKCWTKASTIIHFKSLFESDLEWLEKSKIMAGLIFIKKDSDSLRLINEWLQTMLYFPELICDVMEYEKNSQHLYFSQHRHDQSILSILVRYFEKQSNLIILNEEFESAHEAQIAKTTRKVIIKKKRFLTFEQIRKRIKAKFKFLCNCIKLKVALIFSYNVPS